MAETFAEIERRAQVFAQRTGTYLFRPLGYGIDGSVWQTGRQSALKSFGRQDTFERERDCYRRLFENGIQRLVGFRVPELQDFDNSLWVIEIGLVKPPCILDFGKAYLDQPPDFSPEALAEVEEAERELFTDDEWKQVRLVRAALLNLGIHYFDARPSNIMFPRGKSDASVPCP